MNFEIADNMCYDPDEADFFGFIMGESGAYGVVMFKDTLPTEEQEEKIREKMIWAYRNGHFIPEEPIDNISFVLAGRTDHNVEGAKMIMENTEKFMFI